MEKHVDNLQCFIKDTEKTPFPIQNLPYGVFQHEKFAQAHIGTAIGSYILDLTQLEEKKILKTPHAFFNQTTLNYFASQGPAQWSAVRQQIQSLLSINNPLLQNNSALLADVLIPMSQAQLLPPFAIAGFTDFYASEHHATNVGKLFRGKENALLPNWKYLPVAYNGRASTVFLSGTKVPRPNGQIKLPDQETPIFSPSKKLDFELEMGVFVGVGNTDRKPIPIHQAKSHLFGLVLLNDWSARDIQAFEYQPLGPFLSKSFATSISPWVVPFAALEEFMTPLPKQIPATVEYLRHHELKHPNIKLKVEIQPKGSNIRTTICETNFKELYWSIEQMLAHHTINHCIMKPGDLFGTGTISGPAKENWGSLLEITFNGTQPIQLKDGSQRTFLEDGDTVIMTGYCDGGTYQIGFGSVEGTISSVN
jgi:fumarylacetoacetase